MHSSRSRKSCHHLRAHLVGVRFLHPASFAYSIPPHALSPSWPQSAACLSSGLTDPTEAFHAPRSRSPCRPAIAHQGRHCRSFLAVSARHPSKKHRNRMALVRPITSSGGAPLFDRGPRVLGSARAVTSTSDPAGPGAARQAHAADSTRPRRGRSAIRSRRPRCPRIASERGQLDLFPALRASSPCGTRRIYVLSVFSLVQEPSDPPIEFAAGGIEIRRRSRGRPWPGPQWDAVS